ncbi:hypothetical protein GO755_10550 [Spirosoma sp. HMF4905]|uniref:HTH LytTR-type domain-containing protein n=1 Tax=Spirosoma arboris TaxID=2682092 RepID=A0A7K1S9G4_9BACT|nr:LytTR family DNA-binding domain-containing protein [Spirosoma arboris]MVM30474.1 hypothetical protein [Spirosoma arboris]
MNRTAQLTQREEGVSSASPPFLPILIDRIYRQLLLSQIVRIEAAGCYSWIYTRNGERFLTTQNILSLQVRLSGFWRVHRSHLINPLYILRPVQREGKLHLSTGYQAPIARRRRRQIRLQLRLLTYSHSY